MNITFARSNLVRTLRRRSRAALIMAAVALGGAVGTASALDHPPSVWSWGTVNDPNGKDILAESGGRCFVSGIAGNIDIGVQTGSQEAVGLGCGQDAGPSVAGVKVVNGRWQIEAHGGICGRDGNSPHFEGNPVMVQATCFPASARPSLGGFWMTGENPHFLGKSEQDDGTVRQCFLTRVEAVSREWTAPDGYIRVRRVTKVDQTHSQIGWYVEGNMPFNGPNGGGDSKTHVYADCADFPAKTVIYNGTTPLSDGTHTYSLPSGTGIRACALSGIKGAFDVNAWNDGAIMNVPKKQDGNWSLTVTAGKRADWVCMN